MCWGVAADYTVSLEDQDVLSGGELFPEPGLGQKFRHSIMVAENLIFREGMKAYAALSDSAFERGRMWFKVGRFEICEKGYGPIGTKYGGEVKD